MGKRISFKQYRATDLALFAVIMIVFEVIVVKAAPAFSSQPYSLSIVPAVTCIVYMRWGVWGCIHAVLGGLVFCLTSHADVAQYEIYMAGNLLSGVALLLFVYLGKEKVRSKVFLSLAFAVLVALLMQVGRGLVAWMLGNPFGIVLKFVATDSLSGVFAVVIIWIVRRLDGVFEDQKAYLFRINREEEEERNES
ncbi:MAG: hypothetical protein K6F82_05205 [Sphaerochaetaceae bacterium]|nr:hypothetical protein [Sphaerochaetaceae bacterium]